MKAPTTYFEWKEILDKYSAGDDTIIGLMNDGAITMDAGTATRFTVLIEDAYKKRKQLWMDKFTKLTQFNNIRSSADFTVLISQAKNSLKNLVWYADLKPFNTDLKKVLKDDLISFVGEVKRSLKENALKDRSNQMNSLLLAFNNLDIDKVSVTVSQPQTENFIPNKKKIIF